MTLVELLAVIAIIGLLVALLVPAVQAARETARQSRCANNLRQVGTALGQFESLHGRFPPAREQCDAQGAGLVRYGCPQSGGVAQPATSGFVFILPMLEQSRLYDACAESFPLGGLWDARATNLAWRLPVTMAAVQERPPVMVCPSDSSGAFWGVDRAATGSYAFSAGTFGPSLGVSDSVKYMNNGMFMYRRRRSAADVRDGLANTVFVGESVRNHEDLATNIWTMGGRHRMSMRSTEVPPNTTQRRIQWPACLLESFGSKPCVNGDFGSEHPGGLQFAFGDGHVKFLSDSVSMSVYQALSTVAGRAGETPLDDSAY